MYIYYIYFFFHSVAKLSEVSKERLTNYASIQLHVKMY